MPRDRDDRREQWYDNKDLYEKILEFKDEFNRATNELNSELKETKNMIKAYNNLREMLNELIDSYNDHLSKGCQKQEELDELVDFLNYFTHSKAARKSIGRGIREWGIYVIAIISLFINMYVFFSGGTGGL